MPQSLAQVYLHLVFSTKDRSPCFSEEPIRRALHNYLKGICGNRRCSAFQVGGPTDHVHIGCVLGREMTIASLVRDLKTGSNKWIRDRDEELKGFSWQKGYGAFSIGESGVEKLSHYIENQMEHHRRFSFKDEFRAFCQKYHISIDERYVWD